MLLQAIGIHTEAGAIGYNTATRSRTAVRLYGCAGIRLDTAQPYG